jgi:hypothetical protein
MFGMEHDCLLAGWDDTDIYAWICWINFTGFISRSILSV